MKSQLDSSFLFFFFTFPCANLTFLCKIPQLLFFFQVSPCFLQSKIWESFLFLHSFSFLFLWSVCAKTCVCIWGLMQWLTFWIVCVSAKTPVLKSFYLPKRKKKYPQSNRITILWQLSLKKYPPLAGYISIYVLMTYASLLVVICNLYRKYILFLFFIFFMLRT